MSETAAKEGKTWTAERDAELRTLQASGISTRQIGARMGLSGNAIIGRIHRLGIQKGGLRRGNSIARKKQVLSPRAPLPATVKAKHLPRLRANPVDVNRLKNAEARMAIALQAPEAVPSAAGRVSLLDLEPHQCKWPVTNGLPHLFCGAERVEGRPYCAHHARRAYSGGSNLRPVGLPRSVLGEAA